jgi:hypothetical protein
MSESLSERKLQQLIERVEPHGKLVHAWPLPISAFFPIIKPVVEMLM